MGEAAIRPAARDPIFRLILESSGFLRACVVAGAFFLGALPLLLAGIEGTLVNASLKLDALHDVGYANQFLVLLPFCVLFFPFYFGVLEPSLGKLRQSKIVTLEDGVWESFVAEANRIFSHWSIALLPLVIALFVTGFGLRVFTFAGLGTWNSPAPGHPLTPAAIAGIAPLAMLYYLLPGFVLRVGGIYFVQRRFLSHDLAIQPFHPDGCGGLSPLGHLSLRVMPVGIVAGICSLIGVLSVHFQYKRPIYSAENVVSIAGYIVGLAVVFFVPSFAARSGMLASKEATLQLISDRFNVVLRSAMSSLRPSQPVTAKKVKETAENVKEIEDLTKLYQLANDMPVFPFNSANLVRFFSSVGWPLILLFLGWLKDRM